MKKVITTYIIPGKRILLFLLLFNVLSLQGQNQNIFEQTNKTTKRNVANLLFTDSSFAKVKKQVNRKDLFTFKDLSFTAGLFSNRSLNNDQQFVFHTSYTMPVSIKSIPFKSFLSHSSLTGLAGRRPLNNAIAAIQFNREEYVEQLRKKLTERFNNGLKKELENKAAYIKAALRNSIKAELKKGMKNYEGELVESIIDPDELMQLSTDQIKARLHNNDFTEKIKNYQSLYEQLKERQKAGDHIQKGVMDSVIANIEAYADFGKIIDKVIKVKEKFEKSEIVSRLSKIQALLKSNIAGIKNPSDIHNLVSEHLTLKGIERFFNNVKSVNMGQGTASFSSLSMNGYNMNGMNMELQNRNKYLAVVAGLDNNFNNVWDNLIDPYSPSIVSNVKGVKFGTGEPGGTHAHFSIFNYSQLSRNENMYQLNNNLLLPIARNTNVFTYSQQVDFVGSNLQVEFSKSLSKLSGSNEIKENVNKGNSENNIFQSLAIDASYSGFIEKWKLRHKLHLAYVAPDYINPGSLYLNRGLKEGLVELKKQFYKRKLQVGLRTIYRELKYNPSSGNYSRNLYMNADGRINFKRSQYIAFHYQPSSNYRYAQNFRGIIGENNRITMDGAFVLKVFKRQYRNQVNLISQNSSFLNYDHSILNTRVINAISTQSLLLNRNMIMWNTIYTNAADDNITPLLTSSIFSEVGYTYNLFKNFKCSSGLLYQGYKQYQQQAGIRQSISLHVYQSVDASLFTDLRKSFGRGKKDDLLNNQRLEINFCYNFKK